jgi:ribosomal protein L34E
MKTPKCACCGSNTQGVFSNAKHLVQKLKERKERMDKKAQEIRENNRHLEEEVSDDD